MQILLPTDVFPPRCGGAGWSAHALALALLARGHRVGAVVPRQGQPGLAREDVLGVPTVRYGYQIPPLPFVKNYARHERLWPRLAEVLRLEASELRRETGDGGRGTGDGRQGDKERGRQGEGETGDGGRESYEPQASRLTPRASLVIHAQHVQVAPAAVLAGRQLGAPVVVTIRDHWPWHYFATGLHGDRLPYAGQSWAALATDVIGRLGPLVGPAALAAVPYMQAHLRRRQAFLRQADAVIAVSNYIADRLATIVPPERIHVVPNMVDIALIERTIAEPPQHRPPGPFLLFVGKLEKNKGAHLLGPILHALRTSRAPSELPELVVCGDGPLRGPLERELAALGAPARFLAWADHDEVLRLMARCGLLLFPSAWGDPLSRVLLEACACGAAIVAMPTGGTPDIIDDNVNGALARTPEQFARRVDELLDQPEARRRLGAAAQQTARARFRSDLVVERVERLYRALLR